MRLMSNVKFLEKRMTGVRYQILSPLSNNCVNPDTDKIRVFGIKPLFLSFEKGKSGGNVF